MDEIRDYATKIAERAGCEDPIVWSEKSGVSLDNVKAFMAGGDISLGEFAQMMQAADAFLLPMPDERYDETVILLESEGIYATGTAPDPFDRYRDL